MNNILTANFNPDNPGTGTPKSRYFGINSLIMPSQTFTAGLFSYFFVLIAIAAKIETCSFSSDIGMGGATGGVGVWGDNVPPFLGPAGYRGYRGAVQ